MSGRLIAALLLAPLACSVAGLVLATAFTSGTPLLAVLGLGVLYGTLFEVFLLLPTVVLLRRLAVLSRGRLLSVGVTLWMVAAALNIYWTSELPVRSSFELLPSLIIPGLLLVAVFAWVAIPPAPPAR